MHKDTLRTVYIEMLQRVASIEDQIIVALPKMIAAASNEKLKAGLTHHLEETKLQRERLDEVLRDHHGSNSVVEDRAFAQMLSDAESTMASISDPTVKDAFIIASAQTVEHLEIAKYGTLIEWAKELDDAKAQDHLKETLAEEEAADKTLSSVAKGGLFTTGVNKEAAA